MKTKQTILLLVISCLSVVYHKANGQQNKTAIAAYGVKSTGAYNRSEKQTFPAFSYQDASDENLTALRQQFHLDSVAGRGSETDRAIRLLEWFHNLVPHNDGPAPDTLTALNIIQNYQAKNTPAGCYSLSVAMNEVFLSMGIKSHSVICYSAKFPYHNGGHVIDCVFIDSLQKWIYMDPQENAYIKDEKGNFLSIAEVRERLIDGRPLVLNPTANYHHVPSRKEEYLYTFMAEHLYRVISPVSSEWNYQSRQAGKTIEYVELLPYGSIEPSIDNYETQQRQNYKIICYHTHNDLLFWQKP